MRVESGCSALHTEVDAVEINTDSDVRLGSPLRNCELRGIERRLHLDCSKWDTQVGDTRVLSEQPLILSGRTWNLLCVFAEQLAAETALLESIVVDSPRYQSLIGVPKPIRRILAYKKDGGCNDTLHSTRAMRFDFHPTTTGWRVSEVNSDVPGGWCEASFLPILYQPFFKELTLPASPLEAWTRSMQHLSADSHVALLSAPGFLEDQQVVRIFMRELQSKGIRCSLIQSPHALKWKPGLCALRSGDHRVSVVVRFYQIEWLCCLPRSTGWKELLETSKVSVTNPVISAVSESKRFALLFNERSECPSWRKLMPECCDPRDVVGADWDRFVLKGCYSNTGDSVHLCGSLSRNEQQRLIQKARREPLKWIAQRRFETHPIESTRGLLYPCVGVFVINGRAAGAYVRLSSTQVTDGSAKEAPLFIDQTVP